MIVFTIDDEGLIKQISSRLGEYSSQAPEVLRKSLNDTAKTARTMLADQAKDVYVVQKSKFNKAMTLKSATKSKLSATIVTAGAPLEIIDFKVSSKTPATGGSRPDVISGKVLVKNSMKRLEMGNIKAFVAKFKSGHVSIVQRRGEKRLPVKKLFSPSIPKMIGSEKEVYGKIEPQLAEMLNDSINKYIKKTMEAKKV